MRFPTGLTYATVFLYALTSAAAQSLPSCSAQCLEETLPQSPCAPTNQTCICTDAIFQEELAGCVAANCTTKEILTTLNITNTECGVPVRDMTSPSIIVPSVGYIVLLFLASRIYTRLVMVPGSKLGWDDWTAIALGAVMVAVNAGSILLGQAGLGKDIWTLEFDKITQILKIYYVQELLYVTAITLTKICFLLFYLRIFPNSGIRWLINATTGVVICYGIAFLFAFIFQCSPISFNWVGWDGEHEGSCVDKNALVLASAAANIVFDLWVIALPIPTLLHLQTSTSMKFQIIVMFSIGFLVTGVSIYRMVMLKVFSTSSNPTWDNAPGGYWSIVEVDVGVFILCLPSARALLRRFFPSVFGSTNGGMDSNSRATNPRKPGRASGNPLDNTSFVQLIEVNHDGESAKHYARERTKSYGEES
ncbi:hypothetical protein EYB25_003793 [Talaromyces marneffei]|uniref:Integral membrane protein n=2 Tax=Talaromyces marneffei TaxID=37727 RepID=B6QC38_TALMQ|nr:uncharacterized protein EYB26_006270 [Talaromyces marneffei]EEA26561.1 integral membrane protein [Talaromyces marneffei ATCC 18224]KAE8555245.1 hypothetical protein EYB25_003793 [Talaromyces marneffei]QGA18585.1 hypothetical protein EYB26_006270 [Talaromyces marneffei]